MELAGDLESVLRESWSCWPAWLVAVEEVMAREASVRICWILSSVTLSSGPRKAPLESLCVPVRRPAHLVLGHPNAPARAIGQRRKSVISLMLKRRTTQRKTAENNAFFERVTLPSGATNTLSAKQAAGCARQPTARHARDCREA